MATVTITIVDGDGKIEVDADFEDPGKSFEEMTSNPTLAVAAGLMAVGVLLESSKSFKGTLTDDDGTTRAISSPNAPQENA